MKRIFFLVIKICLTILVIACSKEEIKPTNSTGTLPEETQSGLGTFGASINDVKFNIVETSDIYAKIDEESGELIIYGGLKVPSEGIDQFIIIRLLPPFTENNIYNIGITSTTEAIAYYQWILPEPGNFFDANHIVSGELELKRWDLENKIVSGIFNVNFEKNNETLDIKDGRFDLTISN
ncbi:hypothetical protein [Marinigracilibium pacificum]|uniref:Uncharacterized protein n=1 Tax=Marinigracilibium pacificum TaxID=2729599 RepID=A0A848J189_9BACT|nr:hypothetical protein [Marinigracilibium pacificum]NMM50327.1 hypothetical protein [Marinigracilibium pacificum]